MKPLLVDTGILYAAADADDDWHDRARELLTSTSEPLLVPVTVLPEVCYLLHTRLGPEVELLFVGELGEDLLVEPLAEGDVARAAEVLTETPEIGFVDASVLAMLERLGLERLATTDRRHFAALAPQHVEALELVP